MFVHTVLFWTTPGTPAPAVAQLQRDCHELLGKVPGVRQIWAGRPANTPRDVVDNSYTVGLTVVLDDAAAHDVYQTHELHMQFIARNKDRWQRVQVYDYIA